MVAAALELFDKNGFANVSVEQIADRIEMSFRTIYRYFPSKEDLVLCIVTDINREFLQRVGKRMNSGALITVFVDTLIEVVTEQSEDIDKDSFRIINEQASAVESIRARALLHSMEMQDALTELVVKTPEFKGGTEEARLAVSVFAAVSQVAQRKWLTEATGGSTLRTAFAATLANLPGVVNLSF